MAMACRLPRKAPRGPKSEMTKEQALPRNNTPKSNNPVEPLGQTGLRLQDASKLPGEELTRLRARVLYFRLRAHSTPTLTLRTGWLCEALECSPSSLSELLPSVRAHLKKRWGVNSRPVSGGWRFESKLAKEDKDHKQDIVKVFEYWQGLYGRSRAKLDTKRRSRILARLKEGFSSRELAMAIAGAKYDEFLMGKNKLGKSYTEIHTLLRDTTQVERLILLYEDGIKNKKQGARKRMIKAGKR